MKNEVPNYNDHKFYRQRRHFFAGRMGQILAYVLVGAQLDSLMGTEYVRDAVCIGFICNEALSIIENAGLMGMPLPEILRKSIDALKSEKNA